MVCIVPTEHHANILEYNNILISDIENVRIKGSNMKAVNVLAEILKEYSQAAEMAAQSAENSINLTFAGISAICMDKHLLFIKSFSGEAECFGKFLPSVPIVNYRTCCNICMETEQYSRFRHYKIWEELPIVTGGRK